MNISRDINGACYLCNSDGETHRLRIFDAHAHLYLDGGISLSKHKSDADSILSEMDEVGVEKALIISIAPHMDQDRIFKEVNRHPGRLYFVGSVDPWSSNSIGMIEYSVKKLGAKAIKLHPRLQGFGYENLDLIMPIADYCGKIGVPLILCSFCGGKSLFNSRPVELIFELARRNPSTIIVMAHAGGHRPLEALLVQKACPNVYLEISFSPLYFAKSSVETDFHFMLHKCDSKKIVYGSDYPEKSMSESVEWLLKSPSVMQLSSEDLENILFRNAVDIYKMI
jgi:predicted TIM-barrel fold metal-dependent hydrolase